MNPTPTPAGARFRVAAALAAAAIIVWRIAAVPPSRWWRDWTLILALFFLYTLFRRNSPAWPAVTAGLMAFLLGIYVQGQAPHILAVLGWAR